MKYCRKCKIEVMGDLKICPLCQQELEIKDEHVEELYPATIEKRFNNHMLLKVFGFIAMIISVLAVFFNIILPSETLWSVIVVGVMGLIWLSVATAIKKHKDILKYLWYQILILGLAAIFIDTMTGVHGWAMTFVIPIMLVVAIIAMYVLSKLLRLQAGDYMIYLLLDVLLGTIPFIYTLTHDVVTDIPAWVCILASIISVMGLAIFEGKNMMSELKRRLHV